MASKPIRLAYELQLTGGNPGYRVVPLTASDGGRGGSRISEADLRNQLKILHALDVAIARDLLASSVFGQLGDAQLARLLPLLVQRKTSLQGTRLHLSDTTLRPRARVQRGAAGSLVLTVGLEGMDEPWLELSDGRLLAGAHAFFMRGAAAFPVESSAPWELQPWAREPTTVLTRARLAPRDRDELVAALSRAGVPEADLTLLAVRRKPPERIVATLSASQDDDGHAIAELSLAAVYAGQHVVLSRSRGLTPYVVAEGADPEDTGGLGGWLIERDPLAEEEALRAVRRVGFRYDRVLHRFTARDEAALAVLNPTVQTFPSDWEVVHSGDLPRFHRDLSLRAELQLEQERGLLDLRLGVDAISGDDEVAAALIDMKDLLQWLRSGQRYLQLGDGSYVEPSKRFREGMSIVDDLGASSDRVMVSPLCVGLLRAIGDRAGLAVADQATQAWLGELSSIAGPQQVDPPASLREVLRDYQRRGLDWLMMLHRHRLTGILADDMGLGKTIQALALLLKVRDAEGPRPSLVVAPTSVVSVWRDEARRFAPSLQVGIYHGPPELRHTLDVNALDLLVTSYGILRRDAERLCEHEFRYVILDEAQSAKNASSRNARSVRRLKSERRLALTGTPVENRPEELWAAFDFLAPGLLGNMRQFRKRYGKPIERGDEQAQQLLRARVSPLILRRLKSEVAKELPPKVESVVRCDMLPAQRALYDHVAGDLRQSVRERIARVGIQRAQMAVLTALTRLRQICCAPSLLPVPEGTKVPGSAKLDLFEELMREALASDRRVVVFSQFVQMQKQLIAVLQRLGIEPLWLHGGTRRRDSVVARFQDENGPPVIVVSLRAAGTGLTLTRADTVMHYDPWWNPAVERQATDRAHRLGQRQKVTVYKLVCARSIEERVMQMAADKEYLAEGLLGSDGGALGKRITEEDVLALLA